MYPLLLLLSIFSLKPPSDNVLCNQTNTAFLVGEKINYTIFYNVVGLYVNAGKTDFTIQSSKWNGVEAFTFTATGKSNAKYDWIFKVRDKYESIVDSKTLLPYQFIREINEGSFHHKESLLFNQKSHTVNNEVETFKTPDCTYDVLSAIYAARNYNYKNSVINDKIYLNFFLDKELYPSYFKYLGKEIITTRYGKFKAIKLAPLLIKGTMFEGGEKMTIWVTDDDNHIPVRIQTPIIVGTIKVDMVGFENLRYPLTALIELVGAKE
jgi:hypothetical protein